MQPHLEWAHLYVALDQRPEGKLRLYGNVCSHDVVHQVVGLHQLDRKEKAMQVCCKSFVCHIHAHGVDRRMHAGSVDLFS